MPPEPLLMPAILQDLPVGVWVAGVPRGELVYANAAFRDVLGIDGLPDQVAGAYGPAYQIFRTGGDVYPENELPFARVVAERRAVTVDDIVIHRPDGTHVAVRATGKPIFDEVGQLSHVVVAFIDTTREVTERRRMQATLLASERMVAVGTIAASVAHEINNPLSYVLACLDFVLREGSPMVAQIEQLQRRYPGEPDLADVLALLRRLKEPFANIRDGVERMGLIARDLKTFARPDEQQASPIDVREVLKSAMRMASNETRHRATVVTELEEVPWVMASEPRMAQVFLNLLVNAAQAFPQDRPAHACVIRLSTHRGPDGTVRVEVGDNAAGMPPEILARIFEPFFTTKPVGVGTGLGLAVCRNIVQSFGGEIAASSVVGEGSVFSVTLPGCAPVEAAPPRAAAVRDAAPPPRHVRVLVIDDDHVLGNAFRLTLSRAYAVRVATSGAEGLELLLNEGPFDFVFCDLMMPNMTGMDVFDELARVRPDLAKRLLFMTGGAFDREVREFISRVPNRCLQKPFDPVAVIGEALARGAPVDV